MVDDAKYTSARRGGCGTAERAVRSEVQQLDPRQVAGGTLLLTASRSRFSLELSALVRAHQTLLHRAYSVVSAASVALGTTTRLGKVPLGPASLARARAEETNEHSFIPSTHN